MKVAFLRHWDGYKIGEEIELHPMRAMYLYNAGLVKFIDRPEKIGLADLKAPMPEIVPQGFAENADARPQFGNRQRAKK